MERRRTLGSEKQANAFEPFYSDFPEISSENDGIYQLTPQTEDTAYLNAYIEIGEDKFPWGGGSKPRNIPVTIIFVGEMCWIFNGSLKISGAFTKLKSEKRGDVKYKACSGGEKDPALVTFYVEKIL